MEYFGYAGQVLDIDLSSGVIKKDELDPELIKKYLGGMGINARLAYDLIKPGVDPLGPENVIIFGAGALAGTMTPSATRVSATTKFPVNGAVGVAGGCSFGSMLKWAGYDHVVIRGAADKPLYLQIFDDDVRLCDASHLWGKDIFEATEALRSELGGDISVTCIGQAGENLAKTSMAFIDSMANLGRGGLGAVMGSKKLKAIVVRGTKGIKIADVDALHQMFDTSVVSALSDPNRSRWINYSLLGVIDAWIKAGILVGDNRTAKPPVAETLAKYGRGAIDEIIETQPWGGLGCITSDKVVLTVKKGRFKGLTTTASSGLNAHFFAIPLGIPLDHAVKLHDLMNRYGLDEEDGAYILGLALTLYRDGVITAADTGMELKADVDVLAKAIEGMAYKRGFWGIMADGLPRIVKEIKGAEDYVRSASVKGLATPLDGRTNLGIECFGMLTQPRGGQSFALIRLPATAIPGVRTEQIKTIAATLQIPSSARDRIFTDNDWHIGRLTAWIENINSSYNSLGICYRFLISRLYQPVIAASYYKAVTGISLTPQEFTKIGERVWNLQKAANVREGFTRKDDEFPSSWLTEPIRSEEGDIYLQNYNKTKRIDQAEAKELLDGYYDERKWDTAKGIPTRATLTRLGLADVADDLEKRELLP
jgi:aldehyde:ferredoxin oxidoreductase